MVEVIKIMMTSFKRSHAGTAILSAPNPAAGHHQPMPLPRFLDMHRQVWVSLLWGHGSFLLWVLVHTLFCLCLPKVHFPSPVQVWQLYGGVNGDLLQEGLCHIQVYCMQSPCPATVHCSLIPPQETLRYSSVSVSVGSLGLGAHKVCLSPLSISGEYGV